MSGTAGTTGTAMPAESTPDSGDALAGGVTYRAHLAVGALSAVLALVATAGALAWQQYRDAETAAPGVSAAERGFLLQLSLIAAAAAIVLVMMAYVLLHGRREAERRRCRERQRRGLTRNLGGASHGSEVSDGLAAGLHDAFPGALCIVALEREDHHGLALSASADGAFPSSSAARDLVVSQVATLAHESGSAIVIGGEAALRAMLPGVHNALR